MLLFYVMDTETTGLSRDHEVTQISIIRCIDRNQLSRNIRALHPERATPKALEVTGRTLEDLLKGDERDDVVERVNAFLEEDGKSAEFRCIITHNTSFDRRFCHALWENVGLRFPADLWLDTIKMSKKLAEKEGLIKQAFNLDAALKLAGVNPKPGRHNAISDTRNAFLLWQRLVEEHQIDYLPLIENKPHFLGDDEEDE